MKENQERMEPMEARRLPPRSARIRETHLGFAEDATGGVAIGRPSRQDDDDDEATNRKQNKRSPRRQQADNTQRSAGIVLN